MVDIDHLIGVITRDCLCARPSGNFPFIGICAVFTPIIISYPLPCVATNRVNTVYHNFSASLYMYAAMNWLLVQTNTVQK